MTTIVADAIIESKYAENAQTTQYTSTNITTVIDAFTVSNNTGSNATLAVNLVPSGGAAGASNLVLSKTILAGKSYSCPEVVGQTLASGDFISLIAGTASALVIRASGRKIS
jgi:hypothetical protein